MNVVRGLLAIAGAFLVTGNIAFADNEDAVEELNELLRGEISAIETYRQALEKVGNEPEADTLRRIMNDHETAANTIRSHIKRLGGTPSTDSGAWGTWAKTVTSTATVLGDATALRALKQGEEHGLSEHRELVDEDDVPADIRREIEVTFIPKQQEHIQALDQMIKNVS